MKTKKTRFTLIEILIVVAIIGILATLVANKVGKMRYKAEKVEMFMKVSAIDMALKQYYKDFGDWPRPSNENSNDNRADMRRPFSEIEPILLGDNSKGISYLKSPMTSRWMSSSDASKKTLGNGNNAYESYEFMIALDYRNDGTIDKNVFQNKINPAITEDVPLSSMVWVQTPQDWDTDISSLANSTIDSSSSTKGNSNSSKGNSKK